MKKLSLLSLSLVLLLSACTARGNENPNNPNVGEGIPPTFDTDPGAFLQPLPKVYTDNLPKNPIIQYTINTPQGLAYLIFDSSAGLTVLNAPTTGAPSFVLALFNADNNGYHNIVGYGGDKNNIAGNTSDPLHGKLFTLIAGDKTFDFGYFTVNSVTKLYSYDPVNNKIGDFEAVLGPVGSLGSSTSPGYRASYYSNSGTDMSIDVFARQ